MKNTDKMLQITVKENHGYCRKKTKIIIIGDKLSIFEMIENEETILFHQFSK